MKLKVAKPHDQLVHSQADDHLGHFALIGGRGYTVAVDGPARKIRSQRATELDGAGKPKVVFHVFHGVHLSLQSP